MALILTLYRGKLIKEGFTLIETLVVVSLLGIILVMVGSLFFQTLKGTTKTEIVKEVKQNGDYAINVMSRAIRNAQSVTCGPLPDHIEIVNPDTSHTTFFCVFEDSVSKIASGSANFNDSGQKRLTGKNVTLGGINSSCLGNSLLFVCTPSTVNPTVVAISFTLSQISASGQRVEEQASEFFKQTVSLRTYSH